MHDGCIVWGARVVVPPQGRQAVLQELHEGHLGITKMKALARMHVCWPRIDKEISKIQCAPAPNVKPIIHYPGSSYILGLAYAPIDQTAH